MKNTPFWWEDADLSLPAAKLPTKVDAVVIGAGYSGLSTALVLARAGQSVVVFEAGDFGAGASSRNGGMVGPSFHKLGVAGLKAKFGEAVSLNILRESAGFVDYLEGFLQTEGIDADFKRTGRFLGAKKPAHYDAMALQLETLQNACGVSGEMVTAENQRTETGSTHFCGGLVFHKDGGLNPAKYLAGLGRKLRESGGVIIPNCPVNKVTKTTGGYNIETPRGQTAATQIAICTNAYTGKQFSAFRRRVLPLRSAIIATEELSADMMAELMPKARMYGDSRRIVAYYRPSPDGKRILFGGRATGMQDDPVGNARQLQHAMLEIFPALEQADITHSWSGLVAYSFDHAPHIGQRDGLFFAMGYCGSGVSRASYFGHKLGHKMLGDTDAGRTAFDDLEFLTKPLYSGNPWFMPAVLNWHRMLDKLGL